MSDYKPISCEFHDVLESLATRHENAEVEYLNTDGETCKLNAVIRDVYARGGVEFLALSSGDTLRLDQLVSVNGVRLSDF